MHLLEYIEFLGEYSDDPSSIATPVKNAVCAMVSDLAQGRMTRQFKSLRVLHVIL